MSQCLAFFNENAFSKNRINVYKALWKKGIVAYMRERNLIEYAPSIGGEFCLTCNHHGTVRHQERELIRSVTVLDDMLMTGRVSLGKSPKVHHLLSGPIGEKMELFISHVEHLRRSRSTIMSHRLYLHGFLDWLTANGVNDVGSITEYHVMSFVGTYMGPSKSNIVSSMRMLFKFWNEKGIFMRDVDGFLSSFSIPKREKIPSYYTEEDVIRIEASIDRASAVGKRDYAMTLLASRLGLRASDIAGLTFENLDWDRNVISLTMLKTGRNIELPLLADVGNALIDYLKHGRRNNPSRSVFVSERAPFRPVTSQSVCSAIRRAIEVSGVEIKGKHHGPHSLRHSLASVLLKNGTSMHIISKSLGHTCSTSTMKYLRIDLTSLMKCALPVPPISEDFYNQKGGVFYE